MRTKRGFFSFWRAFFSLPVLSKGQKVKGIPPMGDKPLKNKKSYSRHKFNKGLGFRYVNLPGCMYSVAEYLVMCLGSSAESCVLESRMLSAIVCVRRRNGYTVPAAALVSYNTEDVCL